MMKWFTPFAAVLCCSIAACESTGSKKTTQPPAITQKAPDLDEPPPVVPPPISQETAPATPDPYAEPTPSNSIDYSVKSGDSLWKIANDNNSRVKWIKEANSLASDMIRPGQTLKVPVRP